MQITKLREETYEIDGVRLQVYIGGSGEPLVLLHGFNGIESGSRYLEDLAEHYEVIVPIHPGFGNSTRPDWMDTIDDYAYFYLQFLKALNLNDVHLLGLSLGGWIAAEIAVKSTERLKSLVLADAVGIKISGPETVDITDVFVLTLDQLLEAEWHDPLIGHKFHPSLEDMSEEEKISFFKNRETAALISWSPFMHNPKLKKRLNLIDIPTFVLWGESDGIVSKQYGKELASSIPASKFTVIEHAAHYPYLEKPHEFVTNVRNFFKSVGN